ncbi:glycosyltransferase [Patescibacteria group bacterium]|nr:glycosyltransferase [Patescibacteria group bacterium]
MKRKVLFVITKSNWGGAQRYVFDLATSLPKDQFEAIVAFGGTGVRGAQGGVLAEKLTEADIRSVFISSFVRDISLFKELTGFQEIWNLIRRENPDVVHLNSSKAAGIGALAARLCGVKKIIFTAHGWPFREARNPVSKAAIWFFSWLTALLSHTVICVSDYDLLEAQNMPGVAHKAVRIYNGLDLSMQFGSGEIIRGAFPAGVKITGTVGELTKNKNQIDLIEHAKKDPELYVAIVGEGELRPVLEATIKKYNLEDRVKLFGFQPAHEVMKGFDTFALPSLKEGLPYVILEARVAGLHIVANRTGGVGEATDKPLTEFSKEKMVKETLAVYK